MSNAISIKSRYPGVKPFTTEESSLFFGREEDAEKLYSLIFVKQAVVLYGKSGYGKSSLFNAAITPKLKADGSWELFNVRFNYYNGKSDQDSINPVETMQNRLKESIPENFKSPLDLLIPNENSFWYYLKTLQFLNKQNKFIIFFDQFEELFTYSTEEVEQFSELMSQLLYSKIPRQFRKKMMELEEQGLISEELHDFLEKELEVKVVFAIRSDRLAQMNALTDRHPGILQNCYELQALSRSQAEKAITLPAALPSEQGFATPPFTYTKEALTKILDSITNALDGKTETSTLQIVCRYVEDDLVHEQHHTTITGELLGDITEIFKHYYEGILNRLTPEEKQKSQRLIEDELIDSGRRNPLTASYIQKKFEINEDLLQRLERTSLLRKERDASGRILYEVSHDTLVEAIEKVAKGRRSIEEGIKRAALEEKLKEEKKRADQLDGLNKTIKKKSKRANVFTAVAVVAMLVSWLFYVDANNEKRKNIVEKIKANKATDAALIARAQSELSKRKAIVALCKTDFLEIVALDNKATKLMSYNEYAAAQTFISLALAKYREKLNLITGDSIFLFEKLEINEAESFHPEWKKILMEKYKNIVADSIKCASRLK